MTISSTNFESETTAWSRSLKFQLKEIQWNFGIENYSFIHVNSDPFYFSARKASNYYLLLHGTGHDRPLLTVHNSKQILDHPVLNGPWTGHGPGIMNYLTHTDSDLTV